MEHLSCFSGGMFALGVYSGINHVTTSHIKTYNHTKSLLQDMIQLEIAEKITETCILSYLLTPTKLGPEIIIMDPSHDKNKNRFGENSYNLRPETIESLYILHTVTKKYKYQQWGASLVQAIEKHCKLSNHRGYIGVKNVYKDVSTANTYHTRIMESYFIAETLKYAFLLFGGAKDLVNLTDWVFNTEAHPLRIIKL